MPVLLDTPASPQRLHGDALKVGLLNNLGDGGMAGGERQLIDLLARGCGGTRVHLRLYALPSIARGAEARARMDGTYHDLDALLGTRLDGLFVTGAEPRTADLRGEAFWPELSAVVDWAQGATRSTIWSCLAAHAAVLHLDGVARRPLPAKCTGVYDVTRMADHPLLAGTDARQEVCHSRWNDLDETELAVAGYRVLTRGSIGVDTFARPGESLFVFFQGHPEYDHAALGREASRDIARWRADPACTPSLPAGYFTAADEAALRAYLAAGDPTRAPPSIGAPRPFRRDLGATLMRNWLGSFAEGRERDGGRDAGLMVGTRDHARATPMSRAMASSAGTAAGTTPVRA